jgi:hypothetical protein
LETETDAETLEFTLALQQKPLRIGERDFAKANMIAGTKLRRKAEINRDHVGYFGIASDGLAISQK